MRLLARLKAEPILLLLLLTIMGLAGSLVFVVLVSITI